MEDSANAPRPTLAAVAARAGVSASTASLVFSGAGPVAAATRDRVLTAADALGYAGPDPTARSLRRGRSGIVAVVTEDRLAEAFRDPINLALLDGIGDGFGDEHLGLLVVPLAADARTDLGGTPMDAAILLGCSLDAAATLETLQRRRIPVVAIEAEHLPGTPTIDLDNRAASARAAEHLRALGHDRVAIVTLPLETEHAGGPATPERVAASTAHTALERLAGARAVYPDADAVVAVGSSVAAGLTAGRELLSRPDRPTAILAQSDLIAVGVVRAAEEAGLDVPGELSVVGFDGIRLDGSTPHRLTTLEQPAAEKGRLAARAVLAALSGEEPTSTVLTCTLRIGTTTGPAPTR